MLFKFRKQGNETQILDGETEVATVRTLPSGRFEVQVFGVWWHVEKDGSKVPNHHSGQARVAFNTREEAMIIAAQVAEMAKGWN